MSDESEYVVQQRQHLHGAIARLPSIDPALPANAYLAGWITIAEFVDPDGSRWFCTRTGTDGGDSDLMPWTEKGYLSHRLDARQAGLVADEFERADEDDD